MLFSLLSRMFTQQQPNVMLGRWRLKHHCPSENIVVFNANRDNCGDSLCGDPQEYHKLYETLYNLKETHKSNAEHHGSK